jgi:hypothetical protein
MMRIISSALLLAACSSTDSKPDVTVLPDAMVDIDAPPEEMHVVTIDASFDSPVFIMYRDGTGPWQAPKEVSGGYELAVHDAYEVVAVCGDPNLGYDVAFVGDTYAETALMYLPCYTVFEAGTPVAVTGTMVQPGSIVIGSSSATSTTPNWTFDLDVEQGLRDVVAIANHKMVLRREVDLWAPTNVPTFDVAATGTMMPAVPLTIAGLTNDEQPTVQEMVFTGTDFAVLPKEPGTTAYVVPPALLTSQNSFEWLSFQARGTHGSRSVFLRYEPQGQTSFTLLPPLSGVTFGNFKASWSTLPAGTVDMYFSSAYSTVHMTASPKWLGSRNELAIDTNVPGFQASWLPTSVDYRSLSVSVEDGEASISSSYDSLGIAAKYPVRLKSSWLRTSSTRLSSSASLTRRASRIARRM